MANPRLQLLLKYIEEQPDDLFLKYALGMEYLGMNDIYHAEAFFKAVIAADENHVAAFYQLGKIYESRGEDQEAIRIFEKGLAAARLKNDARSQREFRAALDELNF